MRGFSRLPWRTGLVLLVIGLLGLAVRQVTLEQDPVRSLQDPDPVRAALFQHYQSKNPIQGKIFTEEDLTSAERTRLSASMGRAGYAETFLFDLPPLPEFLELAPNLPVEDVRALLSDEALRQRAATALDMAALPGGSEYLKLLEQDPLGLAPAVAARLGFAEGRSEGKPVRVFQRVGPLDFDRIGALYSELSEWGARVHFIGGDFFAYENYLAVKHDIVLNTALSLVLNLLLFVMFARRWALLGLLLLGTVASNATGLLAARAMYPAIQAVVLAYTSTFVGFNNESLIYLSGIEPHRRKATWLGIWSALGTTLIGFVVLLAGRSEMVRQMAIVSVAGMGGFLLFLLAYRSVISAVRFRQLNWRALAVGRSTLVAVCGLALAGTVLVGMPHVSTRIDGFRYVTPRLSAQIDHFSRRLEGLSLDDVVAIPSPGDPKATVEQLSESGVVDASRHPLAGFRPVEAQLETVRFLRLRYVPALNTFLDLLLKGGVRLTPPPAEFAPLDTWTYLDRLGKMGPVLWADGVGGGRFVYAGLRPGVALLPAGLVPVSPRRYYDQLLTGLSRELGVLFLVGLAAMAIYLVFLHRDLGRVLYIFAPLILAAMAYSLYARLTGTSVNIVHIAGFSLVIGVATDYTAMVISTDHDPTQVSKIFLAGLSALATFGVLIFARHPVLRDLGITVVLGCSVALPFALFVRLKPGSQSK